MVPAAADVSRNAAGVDWKCAVVRATDVFEPADHVPTVLSNEASFAVRRFVTTVIRHPLPSDTAATTSPDQSRISVLTMSVISRSPTYTCTEPMPLFALFAAIEYIADHCESVSTAS